MGEHRAIEQSLLGEYFFRSEAKCLSIDNKNMNLYSFYPDIFIYVHTNAFCYNKCKDAHILEASLFNKPGGEH